MRSQPLPTASLLGLYAAAALLPYLLGLASENVVYRNAFTEITTLASMGGMMLMLVQFALSGRLATVSRLAGIDRGMLAHRKVGEALAILFLLHPLLIVLPRAAVSGSYALDDLWVTFTAPLTETGFYAWSLLIVWVLMAMFRDRLRIRYETWRISHGLGAAGIAVLATDHVITVGRHGHYLDDQWLDRVWIGLCAVAVLALLHTYLIRPLRLARRGFRIASIERVSRSDWCVTVRQHRGTPLSFQAGQFVWLNTARSPFLRSEHPFSIASSTASLPEVSFIVRDQGDYTSRLGSMKPGQEACLEGPFGEFTLRGRSGRGVGLIATGAGIGPVLGLLRQLRDDGDPRPIRLVYGNRTLDQMVLQQEILGMARTLDFRQVLAVTRPPAQCAGPAFPAHMGRVDRSLLDRVFDSPDRREWDYYVCGSPAAVGAIVAALRGLNLPRGRIVYESLAF